MNDTLINNFNERCNVITKITKIENTKYNRYTREINSELNAPNGGNIRRRKHYLIVVCGYTQLLNNQIYNNEIVGGSYYKMIQDNIDYIKSIFTTNDSFGNPVKINTFLGLYEGNNVKYLYHSCCVLDHMKSLGLNNIDIVEIGGGYGGLSYFIHKMSTLFDIKLNSYTIYDIEAPSKLQKKYAEHIGFKINTVQSEKGHILEHKNNYLISCYAFSEFSPFIKEIYMAEVFPYISHGLMAWNYYPYDKKWLQSLPSYNNISVPYREQFGCEDLRILF